MSTDELIAEYEAAVLAQAKAEAAVKVLEMRAKLQFAKQSETELTGQQSPQQKYIESNRRELEQEDIEFLSKSERSTKEVADYLSQLDEVHPNRISERLRDGTYQPGKSDKPRKRTVDTISVIEFLRHGKTKKK